MSIMQWPSSEGPRRKPHPWTVRAIKHVQKNKPLSYENRISVLRFECQRRQLTYKEIAALSTFLVNTHATIKGLSAQTIGKLAREHGMVRAIHPKTKRNNAFFTFRAA